VPDSQSPPLTPESRRPLILDIKGNSLDDGPGIRTVVFFKGCPLSCVWCHNPEGKRPGPEISFDPGECTGCDTCLSACERKALDRANPLFIDRERCTLCYRCVDACPAEALGRVGRFMEVEEVVAQVEEDLPFFNTSGGGVTLSGGEPTLYMDYTAELLARLKEMGVHTLLETCGLFDAAGFEEKILPLVSAIYFDMKIMDPESHREQCGVSNETILENFRKLHERFLDGGPEVLPRVPLIPRITATGENLKAVAGFLGENRVHRVSVLQYNPLWVEKSLKIGGNRPPGGKVDWTSWMDRRELQECRSIFDEFEIV
jgi:pyruvate formate lyase activating enzyme